VKEIYSRVSIRKYKDIPVEDSKITEIIKAGMQAPSAGNQQPWEFYVVTNKLTTLVPGTINLGTFFY